MEAGNRCWDWNVAEMTNRVIVDHIADINLPYSHVAFDNLVNEGMPKERTFITGSPMKEVLLAHSTQIENCDVLTTLGLKKDGYIVVSAHREENLDIKSKFISLFSALNAIADKYKIPVIFSTHPRTRKKLEAEGFKLSRYISEEKPFGFFEYIKLEENAFVVLSDSGTLTEESSILNIPAVLIRTSTERQEGVIHGSMVLGQVDEESIESAIKQARCIHSIDARLPIVPDYDVTDVSARVIDLIKRYVSVIKHDTWLE